MTTNNFNSRYEIWYKLNTERHDWTPIPDESGIPYHLAPDEATLYSIFESDYLDWIELDDITRNPTQARVKVPKREGMNISAGPGTKAFRDADTRTYDLPTKREKIENSNNAEPDQA